MDSPLVLFAVLIRSKLVFRACHQDKIWSTAVTYQGEDGKL